MRRLFFAVVTVGVALCTGVSFAQEDAAQMPEKVRKCLDNLVGTWTYGGSFSGSATAKWDTGKGCLIVSGQENWRDEIGYWTEFISWDGVSDDGTVHSSTFSTTKGIVVGKRHGRVLSPTLLEGKETQIRNGKKVNIKNQTKFSGKDSFISKFTYIVEDDASKPDEEFVFTRVKPTTREDFEEYCRLNQGRWVGEVKLDAGLPGVGKKGEKVTAYYNGTIAEDGNALIAHQYGGKGSSTLITVFDTSAKQIKHTYISSNGSINHAVTSKSDGKWIERGTRINSDGSKTKTSVSLTFSNNGNTCVIAAIKNAGDEKNDDRHDVWQKISK